MEQDITPNMLHSILKDIFTNMLGIEITYPEMTKNVSIPGRACLCSISITGQWNGNLIVQCCDELARDIGANMFAMDLETISRGEVRDAMGEITNMLGGNLKKILPGPSSLSLPNVMFGSDVSWKVPGPASILIFQSLILDKLLGVTIVKRARA